MGACHRDLRATSVERCVLSVIPDSSSSGKILNYDIYDGLCLCDISCKVVVSTGDLQRAHPKIKPVLRITLGILHRFLKPNSRGSLLIVWDLFVNELVLFPGFWLSFLPLRWCILTFMAGAAVQKNRLDAVSVAVHEP